MTSHVFHRRLNREYPTIARGDGAYLWDTDGKRYLDGCGGAFVAGIGHGNKAVAAAMAEQAARVSYVSGMMFTNEPAERLADELALRAPGDLDRVYFLSSGSDAVEAALKLARQYWVERGRASKHKVIALTPSYHGNTLLALSASARGYYKKWFGDWLVDVRAIPAPYAYRCACGGCDAHCERCGAWALEKMIEQEGADSVAAFIAEPVGGSSTGASVPRAEYFANVRAICDRHDVLFIADEIIAGVGRTGTWSAIEQFGVVPDLLIMGKGLAGGAAALSCVHAPSRIVDVLARGFGSLMHGQTFSHHPVACAAGLATVQEITRLGLVERSREMGARMHEKLAALRDAPLVGDVRGRGLLAGVELVADRETKEPLPRALHAAETLADIALEHGLLVWPNHGMADGTNGDLVMLAPPYVITDAQLDEIVTTLTRALERTTDALSASRAPGTFHA